MGDIGSRARFFIFYWSADAMKVVAYSGFRGGCDPMVAGNKGFPRQ
jgi:hypothetical protein